MIEQDSFVPTLECWMARLEMLKLISIEGSSSEQDENFCQSVMDALYESVDSSIKASGRSPEVAFRLTHGDTVLEIKLSASITPKTIESEAKPHDPHNPSQP